MDDQFDTHDTVEDARGHGFFITDNPVVLDWGPIIEAAGLAIYAVLNCHANRDTRESWPSINRIAFLTGLSRNTVMKYLDRMQAVGLVEWPRVKPILGQNTPPRRYKLRPVRRLSAAEQKDLQSQYAKSGGSAASEHPPSATIAPPGVQPLHMGSAASGLEQDSGNKTHSEQEHAPASPFAPIGADGPTVHDVLDGATGEAWNDSEIAQLGLLGDVPSLDGKGAKPGGARPHTSEPGSLPAAAPPPAAAALAPYAFYLADGRAVQLTPVTGKTGRALAFKTRISAQYELTTTGLGCRANLRNAGDLLDKLEQLFAGYEADAALAEIAQAIPWATEAGRRYVREHGGGPYNYALEKLPADVAAWRAAQRSAALRARPAVVEAAPGTEDQIEQHYADPL